MSNKNLFKPLSLHSLFKHRHAPIVFADLVKILLLDFCGGFIFMIGDDDCTFTFRDRSVLTVDASTFTLGGDSCMLTLLHQFTFTPWMA
jgi:hypothetical protein